MRTITRLALAGASMIAIATPALAQEAAQGAEDDGAYASEIIVQARRKDESLQDVPLVVNAVSQDKLNNLQIRNFQDIVQTVPGLLLQPNSNGISVKSSVRGVNFDGNVSGNNGTIEFYWNDAPISAGAMFQGMYDIGQIELLRGPQGTLRGRASPSGSITISSRRPDLSEAGGFVNSSVNSINGWNTSAAINVPIIADKLAIRVAGNVDENQADRVRSINNPLKPRVRTRSGRFSISARPFDDVLALDAVYQVTDRKGRTYGQNESWNYVASAFGETFTAATSCTAGSVCYDNHDIKAKDRLSANTDPTISSQKYKIWNWSAVLKLAGQRLSYVGGHLAQDLKASSPQDFGNIFTIDTAPAAYIYAGGLRTAYVGGGGKLIGFNQDTHSYAKSESHELRLQNDERIFGMFDYVVGFFNQKSNNPTDLLSPSTGAAVATGVPADASSSPTGPVFVPALGQPGRVGFSLVTRRGTTSETSFFGNLTAHIGDATELSGGLRRIHYKALNVPYGAACNGVNAFAQTLDASNFITCPLSPINDDRATVYSASIKHKVNDNVMVYANTGSSWRPGPRVAYLSGVLSTASVGNTSPNGGFGQTSYMALPPEKSTSYEIGFKSEWLDRRLTVNISAFRQKFKNYPIRNGSAVSTVNYQALNANGTGLLSNSARVGNQNFVSPVDVKVKGVEMEVSVRPVDGLSITGNLNYALGKTGKFLIPCNDYYKITSGAFALGPDGIPDADQAGSSSTALPSYSAANIDAATGGSGINTCQFNKLRSALSSPWSGNLQAEYSRPVVGDNDAYIRGNFAWNGKSLNDPLNKYDDVKAYGILNMFVGVRAGDGAWDVSVYAKNLANTFRVINRFNGRNVSAYNRQSFAGNYATGTDNGNYVTAPREFGLNLRYAFGSR